MTLRSALLALACSISLSANAVADMPKLVNVLPGELVDALEILAKQCGVDVIYPSNELRGLRTQGVTGTFETRDAFRKLIEGTPLILKEQDGAVLIALPREATAPAASGPVGGAAESPSGEKAEMTAAPGSSRMAWPLSSFRAAQETEGAAEKEEAGVTDEGGSVRLGEMVVTTGSHIPGAEATSPVYVYGRDDFERVGAATVQQFIATLPQNFGGGQTEDTISEPGQSFNPGLGTAINLRGLGSSATLVLIDGRRTALGGSAEFSDVSLIPLTAVERIEVLTDGASATYGSDAIGGVVNFIMRKDYQGLETRLMAGGSTRGDGERYQGSQTGGVEWNSGSLLFNYEFYSSQATSTLERDFATAPGQYDIIPQQERHSAFLFARQELSDRLSLSGNVLYSKRNVPHYAVFDQFTPEVQDSNIDSQQYVASLGMTLELGNSWSAELSGSASRNEIDNIVTSPSRLNGVGAREYRSNYDLGSADLRVNGDLWELPGGPMQLAMGASYRNESYAFRQAIIGGVEIVPQNEEGASSQAAFAELVVPLISSRKSGSDPRLMLSVAGRFEDYETFGSTFDPKVGVRWTPFSALALRATYGTSFKTPSVLQINEWNAFNSISNLATPTGSVRTVIRNGNNPDLNEETATTWTAGFELSPESMPGFKAHVSWFDVDYEDRIEAISGVTNAAAFNDPFYASRVIRRGDIPDEAFDALIAELLSGRIRNSGTCAAPGRDPVTGQCLEPVSNFNAVLRRGLANISIMHVSGLDVTVDQRFETPVGEFNLGANGSYLFDYEQQISSAAPIRDVLDVVSKPVDLRAKASIGWNNNGWGATTTVNYTDQYSTRGAFSPTTGLPLEPSTIESWITVDLSVRYDTSKRFAGSWFDGVTVSFVASNLFDKDPPTFGDQIIALGYDPANADPMGRLVFMSVSKRW